MLGILEIIVILVVLVAIVGGVGGVVMLIRSAGGGKGSGLCGKCGYSVTGLTHFACPECGSDLREVGITNRAGGSRGLAIGLVIFGALGLLCLVSGVVLSMLMFQMDSNTAVGVPTMPAPTQQVTKSAPEEDPDTEPADDQPDETAP